jgi:hypothetical protein
VDRATPTPLSQVQLDECIARAAIAGAAVWTEIAWRLVEQLTPTIRTSSASASSVDSRQRELVNCRFTDCTFQRRSPTAPFERCTFYDSDTRVLRFYATLRNARFEACDLDGDVPAYACCGIRCARRPPESTSNTDFGIGEAISRPQRSSTATSPMPISAALCSTVRTRQPAHTASGTTPAWPARI